jgi:MAPEG family
MSSTPNLNGLEPVLGVTVGFMVLYYIFLYGQAISKFYLFFQAKKNDPKVKFGKIKYNNPDLMARVSDRTTGNMMEQAIPFLVSLWLCAIFESPTYAAKMGWLWLLFRSFYPFVFSGPWLPLSTVPGYVIVSMLLQPVAIKATYSFF